MRNAEWAMCNEEWKMENEKGRILNEEWGMGTGKLKMGN